MAPLPWNTHTLIKLSSLNRVSISSVLALPFDLFGPFLLVFFFDLFLQLGNMLFPLLLFYICNINGYINETELYGHGSIQFRYTGIGRINGIQTWQVPLTHDDIWKTTICIKKFSADDDRLTKYMGWGSLLVYRSCKPFMLDDDEYIHGYRVLYYQYINGIQFRTNKGNIYSCFADTNGIEMIDTGWVYYNDSYLSGFIGSAGLIIDLLGFQFTQLPFPTQMPTNLPTSLPTNIPTSLPTKIPTCESSNCIEVPSKNNKSMPKIITSLVVVMVLIILGILVVFIYKKKSHKTKERINDTEMNDDIIAGSPTKK